MLLLEEVSQGSRLFVSHLDQPSLMKGLLTQLPKLLLFERLGGARRVRGRGLGHLDGAHLLDMTTGAAGEPVTLAERLADIERRYDAGHVVARSVQQARPELEPCIQYIEASLRSSATP
jgi:hypothetical protein